MDAWLKRSGVDIRFVNLATFMTLFIWPWLVVATVGLALVAWKFVLFCQAVALPFSLIGWAFGFRLTEGLGWTRPARAMAAGWAGLLVAEIGLALTLRLWFGPGVVFYPGIRAFPGLAVLMIAGVLWLYRGSTWPHEGLAMQEHDR